MEFHCKARSRQIPLSDCVPNPDHTDCQKCDSPNREVIAARSPLQETSKDCEKQNLKPIKIADLYLIDAAKLPYPLNQPDAIIDVSYQEGLSPKLLKTLTASYSEDIVKRVCMALLKFDLAMFRFDFSMTCNKTKIEASTTREENLKGIDAGLASHPLNRRKMPSVLETGLKDWLIREKESLSNIKTYTPSHVLDGFWVMSPPFKIPAKRPNNPLVKALHVVIYRLLDNGRSKAKTQELTATVINDFYKTYDCLYSMPKRLTAKVINDSLFKD